LRKQRYENSRIFGLVVNTFADRKKYKIKGFVIENSYKKKRNGPMRMSISEIMTIIIMFHMSGYKIFKDFYMNYILYMYRKKFPKTVSYNRFVTFM
jgi:hypothetical protein